MGRPPGAMPSPDSDAVAMNQWPMIARWRTLLPAGAFLYLACSPTDPGCVDICTIWSVLEGTVATSAGVPVPEADVELRLMYDGPAAGGENTCQLLEDDEVDLTTTDAAGAFFARLDALSILPPDCVEVTVDPPEESGLSSVVDTVLVEWSLREESAPRSHMSLVLPNSDAG